VREARKVGILSKVNLLGDYMLLDKT